MNKIKIVTLGLLLMNQAAQAVVVSQVTKYPAKPIGISPLKGISTAVPSSDLVVLDQATSAALSRPVGLEMAPNTGVYEGPGILHHDIEPVAAEQSIGSVQRQDAPKKLIGLPAPAYLENKFYKKCRSLCPTIKHDTWQELDRVCLDTCMSSHQAMVDAKRIASNLYQDLRTGVDRAVTWVDGQF